MRTWGGRTFLELRVAQERGAEHRMAALVVVDAGLTGYINQNFDGHARGSLWGAPILDMGSAQRKNVIRHEAQEGVGLAPEAGVWSKARFERVESLCDL